MFFDNILIYSKTWEEHLKHLDEVLRILEEHSLYAKMFKCTFGMKEMLYLGHIISAQGGYMYIWRGLELSGIGLHQR